METLTGKQMEVIAQFHHDGELGLSGKTILDKELADKIQGSINNYSVCELATGNIVIIGELSANGGTLTIREIVENDSDFNTVNLKEKSAFVSLVCKETCCMIEPSDYPVIEPYNRQNPYYCGYSYANLVKSENGAFNTYVLKDEISNYQRHISFEMRDFYYNDYWKTISFKYVVSPENLKKNVREIFDLLGYNFSISGFTE